MYLKKMLFIIIMFISSLIIFSLFCNLLFYIYGSNTAAISDNLFKLPLYIIGYGESPSIDRLIQLILCISGLIMVNFLNAYLTVALFRFKRVKIEQNLIKGSDNDYTLLLNIVNKGKQIFNASNTCEKGRLIEW